MARVHQQRAGLSGASLWVQLGALAQGRRAAVRLLDARADDYLHSPGHLRDVGGRDRALHPDGSIRTPRGRPQIRDHSVLGDRALITPNPRDGSFHSHASRLPAHAGNRGAVEWYGERRFQLWGGGLAALFICGLLWISCMGNGFGLWDLVWLAGAGGGALVAVKRTKHQPGGRTWTVGLAFSIAVLGLGQLGGGAPWLIWAAFWVLAVACGVQFGRAAANA